MTDLDPSVAKEMIRRAWLSGDVKRTKNKLQRVTPLLTIEAWDKIWADVYVAA